MDLRESLEEPVSKYMSTAFAKAGADDTIYQAAVAMKQSGATEAVVMKGGEPVGIITERDIVYKVVARGLVPQQVKVKDVMSSPVESVEENTKVLDAISKMSKLGLRRLGVTRNGKLVGMVTQKAMVAGPVEQHVVLPELAHPERLSCPYCGATLKDQHELSKHIDQVHLGLGLLEGNTSKW
jgi:CBS domain-containing protein